MEASLIATQSPLGLLGGVAIEATFVAVDVAAEAAKTSLAEAFTPVAQILGVVTVSVISVRNLDMKWLNAFVVLTEASNLPRIVVDTTQMLFMQTQAL